MKTSKSIATISFNTPVYLQIKLQELQQAGKVSYWAYIVHHPEDDEGGKKQHQHVFVQPSRLLQSDDLTAYLLEYDPDMPDKPRKCLSWVTSVWDHWFLYALHDSAYLASKGKSRIYHYSVSDIVTSDADELLYRVRSINMLEVSPYTGMLDAMRQGLTWPDYFARGLVPIQQVMQYERAWNCLLRASGDNHA